MKLSVVTTLYQSAPYILEFYHRASAAARQHVGEDYEIVLVNDGSPDISLDLAVQLTECDYHVIVIDLSRNFGHHKAMMAGLAETKGEHVLLIDSDLEEAPECLVAFADQMKNQRCDVVYGVQEQRKGGWFERWSGQWFWLLFNFVTGLGLPLNVATVRLMSRRYVDALLCHDEREVFMAGLWHITGFDQRSRIIEKSHKKKSAYTLRRKVALFVNAITSFSNAPLISIFYIGVSIFIVAGIYTGYIMFHWLFLDKPASGWTSVMASIWVLGGLIISFIGVIGIYLSKIFSETKRRPYVIVRQIYGKRE
jgi:putative glycosyltransferase